MGTTTTTTGSGSVATLCGCGCGTPVARRYAPGHDARHKSQLRAALVSGDWRAAWHAADTLADLGWAHFADPADLRAVPYRTPQGRALVQLDQVTRWQVTPCGTHHADRRCPALTRQARAAGALGTRTRLARDSWLTFADATPELAHYLANSWDLCTECVTEHTREVYAESLQVGMVEYQQHAFANWEPVQRNKTIPSEWQVEGPDGQLITVRRNPTTGTLTHIAPTPPPAWGAPNPATRVA